MLQKLERGTEKAGSNKKAPQKNTEANLSMKVAVIKKTSECSLVVHSLQHAQNQRQAAGGCNPVLSISANFEVCGPTIVRTVGAPAHTARFALELRS